MTPSPRQRIYKIHCLRPMFENHLQVTCCLLLTRIVCRASWHPCQLRNSYTCSMTHICILVPVQICWQIQTLGTCQSQLTGHNCVAKVLLMSCLRSVCRRSSIICMAYLQMLLDLRPLVTPDSVCASLSTKEASDP